MKRRAVLSAAAASILGGCTTQGGTDETPSGTNQTSSRTATPTPTETRVPESHPFLEVPDGFSVRTLVDTDELGGGDFTPGPDPGPRLLDSYQGTLYATIPSQGRVVAITEDGAPTEPPTVVTVVEDLPRPHGIAFFEDSLYLALAGSIVRYRMYGVRADAATKEVLVDDVPEGRYHWTRSLAVHDSHIYLSAGSCASGRCGDGNDDYLAAITRFDLDGSNPTTYARGLRNAVGIGWHDGSLFATDNGEDNLGPNLPPDEINVVGEGEHFGFPECYGDDVPVEDASESTCESRTPAAVELQAHVAPLGFDFYTAEGFPPEYRGDMYVALHGSWRRKDPVGYKVLRVPYADGSFGTPADFVTGWLPPGADMQDARGRPVDVHVLEDGTMYVSDDLAGAIHQIWHN